ncbi:MAG TPA: RNA polymerase sigma factor [Polyangiaceae bacterium]
MSVAAVLETPRYPTFGDPERATLRLVSDVRDLVERCKAGDNAAFREIFRLHRTDVARLVQRMLGQSSDLDDLVQEVFLQVHRSIRDFRSEARFSTWLYRVAVNVVLMHRRAARSRPVLGELPDTLAPADVRELPDDALARQRRVSAFYRLLEGLSEKKRTVFVLHEIEGLPPAEIARVVGSPVLTVRTRLFYARRELLAQLDNEPALAAISRELGAAPEGEREGEPT